MQNALLQRMILLDDKGRHPISGDLTRSAVQPAQKPMAAQYMGLVLNVSPLKEEMPSKFTRSGKNPAESPMLC